MLETGEIVYRKRLDFDGNLYASVTAARLRLLSCTRYDTGIGEQAVVERVALNRLKTPAATQSSSVSECSYAGSNILLHRQVKNL